MTQDPLSAAVAPWVVAALYQFKTLPDPAALREQLLELGQSAGLCGTLIVAGEGINGTVAGSREAIDRLHAALLTAGFDHLEYKESYALSQPFKKYKVRLKKEIVTLGASVEPLARVGHYVDPQDWNALIADPDVVVIDTRNDYEYKAGTFQRAIDPQTATFREFPAWVDEHLEGQKDKKIAMFCTGGIRCEKATSYLLERGFQNVYHLKGGVLAYLEHVPAEESRWEGECFVFDERVTVGHGLKPTGAQMCYSCGWPLTPEETQHPHFERGVSCEHCYNQTTEQQKKQFRDRQKMMYETH